MNQPAAQQNLDHAAIRSIMIGIMLAMLLAAIDQTIVATALPTIGQELGDVQHLPWVVTAYLLTSTAVTPLYGKAADIYGRRIAMLVGVGVFIMGSVVCAVAPNMMTLVIGRAVQGLGGGGLISLGQTIMADVVAPKERGRYQAYFAAVFATSSIAGPVLGGYFAEHLGWEMIFWINLPLGLVAYFMSDRLLRRLPRHERPHKLDVLGAVLMTAATVAFLLALSWGGTTYPWASKEVLGLLAASLVLAVLFVIRLLTAPEPLLPLAVIRNPIVAIGTAVACFAMAGFIGLAVYLPIYFQAVMGLSVSHSGLAIMSLTVGTIIGATTSGRVMIHVRHYLRLPLIGLGIAALMVAILAWQAASISLVLAEVLLTITGLGVGTVLPVSTVAIQNAVPMHQMGTATAVMNFFRSLGGAIIVTVYGVILIAVTGADHAGAAVDRATYAHAFTWVFALTALSILGACLTLLALEERPLRSGKAPPAAAD